MFYLSLMSLSAINADLLSYWLILEASLTLALPFILNNKFGLELGRVLVSPGSRFVLASLFLYS